MCVCMYVLYLLYRGEDEYLIALDDTRWLYRVQELLQTAAAVVTKLEEEHASVLVSYDSGRDRTGQVSMIVSLSHKPVLPIQLTVALSLKLRVLLSSLTSQPYFSPCAHARTVHD